MCRTTVYCENVSGAAFEASSEYNAACWLVRRLTLDELKRLRNQCQVAMAVDLTRRREQQREAAGTEQQPC